MNKMVENEKQALVPQLRFPEFRDTKNWRKVKLSAVATLYKGKGIAKADIVANGVQPCIRYGELYTIYGETIHETASSTNVDASELFLSKKNDVIIPASGETKIDIAKASCVMSDDIALGGDLNVIRSSQNGIFLSYQLNGPLRLSIAKVAQGDTVVHLYPTQIEQLDVLLPPDPIEQKKIADCLSYLDALFAAQAEKLDALKTHKKGLMQQLFPRAGETVPSLRFPEFRDAGEWKKRRLSEVLVEHGLKSTGIEEVFSVSVHKGLVNQIEHLGRSFSAKSTDHYNRVLPGDIVYTKSPTGDFPLGIIKQSKLDVQVIVSPLYGVFSPETVALGTILDAYFESPVNVQYYLEPLVQKGAKNTINVNNDKFLSASLILPEIKEEQKRIADCLSYLDALFAAQAEKL
ncbi:MAG: restriction endonuclease subunit S, partial [Chlorobiales bacterium]|nr:restriction endonuclease subunit S [Chlorobiales bacterium]